MIYITRLNIRLNRYIVANATLVMFKVKNKNP